VFGLLDAQDAPVGRIPEPRLPHRRRRTRRREPPHRRPRPIRQWAPVRRPPRARLDAEPLSLCFESDRLSASRPSGPRRPVAGSRSRRVRPWPDDLRPSSAAAPRPHRTRPGRPSLSHHASRRSNGDVFMSDSTRALRPRRLARHIGVTPRPTTPSRTSTPHSSTSCRKSKWSPETLDLITHNSSA
jgi:hypothetical protein